MIKTIGANLGYLLIRCLMLPLIGCPRWLVPLVAKSISWVVWLVPNKEIKQLKANVRQILGLPMNRFGREFCLSVIRHQIESGIETLQEIARPGRVRFVQAEQLQQVMEEANHSGRGQVLITAHLGSWELLGYQCARIQNRVFNVLAKPAPNQPFQQVLQWMRTKMQTPVLWSNQKTIAKQMLIALNAQEWLGFVMDQKPAGRKGPVVDFFGHPTEFVIGPAAMVCRNQRPLVAAFCVRTGPFEYRLLGRLLHKGGDPTTDPDLVTQECAQAIEKAIRLYPEQWCWNYKRWSGIQ